MINNLIPVHILLADDDEDDRLFFQESLGELSIPVFLMTVKDGEELMGLLSDLPSSPPPHVIFLDINMPLKNGIECLKEIKSNRKFDKVPVFMFSTSTSTTEINLAYAMGANLYIPKAIFFSSQKQILERLFSVHWEKYLSKIPKEDFILTK